MTWQLPDIGNSVIIAGNPRSGKTQLAKYLASKDVWGKYFRNTLILQVDKDTQRGIDIAKPWEDYANAVIPWREATSSVMLQALREYEIVVVNAYDCPMGRELMEIWGRVCGVS